MPGAMRKMGVYLGLVEEDDGYADLEPADAARARGEYAADPRRCRAIVRGRAPGRSRLARRS